MKFRTAALVGSLGALAAMVAPDVRASSHREAPFITKNPKVDGTDFYMFRSYEVGRDGYVTLVANYLPLQDAYGGPNYFTMDPEALYEIEVDNTGDGIEDITFQFRFSNTLNDALGGTTGVTLPIGNDGGTKAVSVPVINANAPGTNLGSTPITAGNENSFLNVVESYSLKVVRGTRRAGTASDVVNASGGATTFRKPVDYIGTKSNGNAAAYETYAQAHAYNLTIPGCTPPASTTPRVFVGQRAEGFHVNLGTIFDLVNADVGVITNPANRAALNNTPADVTRYKNVTTIALEVPITCLTSAAGGGVLGGWTTASVRQARVINPQASYLKPSREGGAWTQVSRLGNPLVNEVVIGIKDKDRFNSSEPKDDAQFADYVTNPTLPKFLGLIFGNANLEPALFPRTDLVTIFLSGVNGVNQFPAPDGGTVALAEMLRLNTGIAPTTLASGQMSELGAALCFPHASCTNPTTCFTPVANHTAALGSFCDYSGFPNGRRPADDVVDIALTSVIGYFVPAAQAPAGGTVLHDAVSNPLSLFKTSFPYLNTPNPGAPSQ